MQKIFLLLIITLSACILEATPSSVFWTNCTTDVYDPGIGNLDVDNYFSLGNHKNQGSSFPTDIGFELGLLQFNDFKVEAGVDFLGAVSHPFLLNAAIAVDENKLFHEAPSCKIGIFNAGFGHHRKHDTNQNIVDIVFGKSLPEWIGGRLFIGGFSGNRAMGKDRCGYMIAYQKPFCEATDTANRKYYKWMFCADYASGKNIIGGGGVAIGYSFTPDISILTGPTWFNSTKLNGHWKWSIQLNIRLPVFNKSSTPRE